MSRKAEPRQSKIDLETAIRTYNDYLENHPYSFVFLPLANLYRKQGRFDDAIGVCLNGLRVFPGYFSARAALGLALRDKGDSARARVEFERVESAVPDNVLARRVLAELCQSEGEVQKAADHLRAISVLFPDHEETTARLRALEEQVSAVAQKLPVEEAEKEAPEPPEPKPAEAELVEEAEETEAAVQVDEGPVPVAEPVEPPDEVESDFEQVATGDQEDVPDSKVAFPREPGIQPEGPKQADEFDEFSEESVQEKAASAAGTLTEEVGEAEEFDEEGFWAEASAEAAGVTAEPAEVFVLTPPSEEGEVPVVEEGPPEEESADDPRQQPLAFTEGIVGAQEVPTQTLAELYEAQGHMDSAIEVYCALLRADPSRSDLRQKLEKLLGEGGRSSRATAAGREQAERISVKPSPFFVRDRGSGGGALAVEGSFMQEIYEQKRADRVRRGATRKVVAELDEWLRRLQDQKDKS